MQKNITLNLIVIITLLLSGNASIAQSWKWAQRHGGDSVETASWFNVFPWQERQHGWNSVVDLATDAQNNIYAVSLVLSKYLDVNGQPLSGWGKSDMLLTSYTCDGALRWSKVIGSNQDSDVVVGVRCDDQGVIVSGMTSSNFATGSTGCHFSTDTVTGSTAKNIFLAKWDFNGHFQWLRMPQPDTISPASASSSALVDMDATLSGDTTFLFCYLSPGSYGGGAYQVFTSGMNVLKYTGSGAFAGGVALPYRQPWLYTLYLSRWCYNSALHAFVVSGRVFNGPLGTLDIGSTQLHIYWAYLASFDAASGNLNFLLHDTSFLRVQLRRKVVCDEEGNIYLSGCALDSANFNGVLFLNPIGDSTAYFSTSGLAPFVMKINGKTGAPLWTTRAQANSASGLNMCLRKSTLLLTGEYTGTLSFPGKTISNNRLTDSSDAYIAYLDTATGSVRSLSSLGAHGLYAGIFNVIIPDRKSSYICAGSFQDSLVLGSSVLVEPHPAIGPRGATTKTSDAWIGKLGWNNCNCSIAAGFQHVATYGTTSYFTYTGSTNLDSLVWDWGDGTQTTYRSGYTNTISHSYTANGLYQVCVTAYNDSCLDSKACKALPLRVPELRGMQPKIYPNPATQTLTVTHFAGGNVRIFSVTGQVQFDGMLDTAPQTISLAKLAPGYYLLLLEDRNGQRTQRSFVKE